MKNIILDGQTYSGISEVSLPISGGTALFKDKDEIVEPSGSLSINANGTYDVTDKASAVVNVPAPEINLQNKTATANGEVTADEGYDGLGTVTVAVSGDTPTYQEKTATQNGVVLPDEGYDALSKVTVNVPAPVLPTLTNPASASDILSGKEALDGDGAKLTGTCTFDADTSDADATAGDILQGKTAYVNGVKLLGTLAGGGEIAWSDYDVGTATAEDGTKMYIPYNSAKQPLAVVFYAENATAEKKLRFGIASVLTSSYHSKIFGMHMVDGVTEMSTSFGQIATSSADIRENYILFDRVSTADNWSTTIPYNYIIFYA